MKVTVLALAFVISTLTACQRGATESISLLPNSTPTVTPEPEPTKPNIPRELLDAPPEQLCSRLAEIKTLPTHEPTPTDPIYEALLVKGQAAIPCLVENIGNGKQVPDPRYSVPTWHSYAVGDTALFTLLDILSKDDGEWEKRLLESVPPKFRKEWKTNGIYAYFNYVFEPKHRKELQRWWKNWLSKNENEQSRTK